MLGYFVLPRLLVIVINSCIFLSSLLPNVFAIDSCFSNTSIRHLASSPTSNYELLESSGICVQRFSSLSNELTHSFSTCSSTSYSLELVPVAVFSDDKLPSVALEISLIGHEDVSNVFLRFECLYAPNHQDVYCHDSEKMIVDGIWRWPCRGAILNGKVQVPWRFSYNCFRLFGQSQYRINVTLFPQNCVATFLISSPPESHLFPSIAQFYSQKDDIALATYLWSPAIIVDLSDDYGVWFRVVGPVNVTKSVREIILSLFSYDSKTSLLKPVQTFSVRFPHTGVKWENSPTGEYCVYAHVPRHDCVLLCDDEDCKACQHTMLNFTISVEKAHWSWRALGAVKNDGLTIVIILAGFGILSLIMFKLATFALSRMKARSLPSAVVPNRVKVLLVYSDDCEEHSKSVENFASILKNACGADVILDQWEFPKLGTINPYVWLPNVMRSAEKVLIIVSPCSQRVLSGDRMVLRRPFPDLFSAACTRIFADNKGSNDSRFALIHFQYSPTSVHQLHGCGFRCFEVPLMFHDLVAFLHGESANYVLNIEDGLLEVFNTSIRDMMGIISQKPEVLENRFKHEVDPDTIEITGRAEVDEQEVLLGEGLLADDSSSIDEGIQTANLQNDIELLPESDSD